MRWAEESYGSTWQPEWVQTDETTENVVASIRVITIVNAELGDGGVKLIEPPAFAIFLKVISERSSTIFGVVGVGVGSVELSHAVKSKEGVIASTVPAPIAFSKNFLLPIVSWLIIVCG